jgi:predicted dehydrogenase
MDAVLNKTRIGIIGCGKIVESAHLPVLMNIPGVNIEWIFDKSETRSSLLAEMYRVKAIPETELKERMSAIDICLLTVPYGVRLPYIQMCAELQKGLYVEKPFAVSASEHNEYCSMFAKEKLAVGFQRRYYHTVKVIGDIINERLLGSLRAVRFSQGYFQLKGGTGFMSDAKMSGGGVIIESAIHALDQILQFSRATDVTVTDVKGIFSRQIDYDTTFAGIIGTKDGAIPYSCHISCLRNLDNGLELEFENGNLECMLSPGSDIRLTCSNTSFDITGVSGTTGSAGNVNAAFVLFWKDFIQGYHTQQPNITSGVSSILTTKWIEQIYSALN